MDNDLISRSDIKDHISELLLVYSGAELANALLNAIDNAPAISPYKAIHDELHKCEEECMDEDAKQASIPYSYQMPKDYIKNKLDYSRPQDDIFPMKIVAGKCSIEVSGNCPLKPQGEWLSHYDYCKKHGYNPSASIAFWWCDQCGQGVEQPTNFCPNCGAKMNDSAESD